MYLFYEDVYFKIIFSFNTFFIKNSSPIVSRLPICRKKYCTDGTLFETLFDKKKKIKKKLKPKNTKKKEKIGNFD